MDEKDRSRQLNALKVVASVGNPEARATLLRLVNKGVPNLLDKDFTRSVAGTPVVGGASTAFLMGRSGKLSEKSRTERDTRLEERKKEFSYLLDTMPLEEWIELVRYCLCELEDEIDEKSIRELVEEELAEEHPKLKDVDLDRILC